MILRALLFAWFTSACPAAELENHLVGGTNFSQDSMGPMIFEGRVVAIDNEMPGKPAILHGRFMRSQAPHSTFLSAFTERPSYWGGLEQPLVTNPPLRVGEKGFWLAGCSMGRAFIVNVPAFGRPWPVIEGRDAEYPDVKAWAELLFTSQERLEDLDGKQWPAPPAPPRPAPVPPPSFIERLLPVEPAPRPAMPPSGSVEPRGFKAAWPWLTGMLVSLVLGLLIGAGLARKREI